MRMTLSLFAALLLAARAPAADEPKQLTLRWLGQSFFVRQNAGPSLLASVGTVTGPLALSGHADHPGGHASFDADGSSVSQAGTNLDITSSSITAVHSSGSGHHSATSNDNCSSSGARHNLAAQPVTASTSPSP